MKVVCSVVFAIALSIVNGHVAVAANGVEDGFVISQKHTCNGKQVLYICPNKIRIDNLDPGYSIIADATNGSMWFISTKKQLRFRQPIGKYKSKLAKMSFYANLEIPSVSTWQRCYDEQILNLKGTCYCSQDAINRFSGSGGYLVSKSRKSVLRYSVYVCKAIRVAKSLEVMLNELQGTPQIGGVPLKFITQTGDQRKYKIETLKVSRQSIAREKWAVPAQYKEAKSEVAVTSGDSSLLEEFVGRN